MVGEIMAPFPRCPELSRRPSDIRRILKKWKSLMSVFRRKAQRDITWLALKKEEGSGL